LDIHIENLCKVYQGKKSVIENLNLDIKDTSFTILVGPSGCGKTTLLRILAGLEDVTSGKVLMGGDDVTHKRAEDRDIAMVFQNYALYPHMTLAGNIEFGLKNRRIPKEDRMRIIQEVIQLVGLEEYIAIKPSNMSGGQRQRVALARAISKSPKVFLMDEPLSNLDAKLRAQMRSELILLHQKLATTFVYVTHDQVEAMTMGDNIVIMNMGKIMQTGSPSEVYKDPKNIFVAQFIGNPGMNIINLGEYYLGFRPNHVTLGNTNTEQEGTVFGGRILTRELLGSEVIYSVDTRFGQIKVKCEEESFTINSNVSCHVATQHYCFFDKQENRLYQQPEAAWIRRMEDYHEA